MGAKEDFISLFRGHEAELDDLPRTHFHIKDFSYMITSQRTTDRILEKLRDINSGNVGVQHQNFWADLARIGLVNKERNGLSLFGKAVLDYFESETDDFKREHFIFNGIRQRSYDIDDEVVEEYEHLLQNLYECIGIIPAVNHPGEELIKNKEKLLITAFLNTFPYALVKYYQLNSERQRGIDTLRESGLSGHFGNPEAGEEPYTKAAQRLLNIWRALDRRVNFVKSAVLCDYEERCLSSPNGIPFDISGRFEKILNKDVLAEIIQTSDKIQIVDSRIVPIKEAAVHQNPRRIVGRMKVVRKRRLSTKRRINRPEDLAIAPSRSGTPSTTDPMELAQERELRDERTREHQKLVEAFWSMYREHSIECDQNNFDLLVEKGNFVLLHEMKTTTPDNERLQIMKAVGQLFYYEFFEIPRVVEDRSKKIVKIIVLQHKPTDLIHVEYLKSLGIYLFWIGDGGRIEGEPDSMAFLKSFLE